MPKVAKDFRPAKIRAAEKNQIETAVAKKIAEELSWKDDVPKKKNQLKREEKDSKRDETLRKKAELKALERAENAALARTKKPKVKKVTIYTIEKEKAAREELLKEEKELKKLAKLNITPTLQYTSMLDQGNMNRPINGEPEAIKSGVAGGLAQLEGSDPSLPSVWTSKLYEKVHMARLKDEKPGMKASGYRQVSRVEYLEYVPPESTYLK